MLAERDARLPGTRGQTDVKSLAHRRPEVVRRLLDRGLAPSTLRMLLPGWDGVIAEVSQPTDRDERPAG